MGPFQIIAKDGATAIAVDANRRLVRHEFRTDVTEELFSRGAALGMTRGRDNVAVPTDWDH